MKTFKGCIDCFRNQIIKTSKLINLSEDITQKILQEVDDYLLKVNFELPPAAIGGKVYDIFHSISNNYNPYKKIKSLFIKKALLLTPFLEKEIKNSTDKLKTASKIASIGNVIDFGINNSIELDEDFNNIIKDLLKKEYYVDDFSIFYKKLKIAKTILYIGDNAGESVFDMIFIKQIKNNFPDIEIIFATREKPIINDVIIEDAIESKIDKYAKIISSGVDTPGTILEKTTTEFKNIFNKADIIISKGQGNFEGLSDCKKDIFFILKIKCEVISKYLKIPQGNIIFLYKEKNKVL